MYTAREVATVLGVPPSRLRAYLRSGLVSPGRGEKGELRFSFQDLILLRRAEGLVESRIPPARVQHALRRLRERWPDGVPLLQVQLEADGGQVVVSDGKQRWEPSSGQVVFDFTNERGQDTGILHELPTRPATPPAAEQAGGRGAAPRSNAAGAPISSLSPSLAVPPTLGADDLYELGYSAEEAGDAKTAMARYQLAIARDPNHADARVNLGRLLHEAGRPGEALGHYRAALAVRPDDAIAAFNLGVALEDLGQRSEAIEAYRRAIALAPDSADAHYNVARLYEQGGESEFAIRHLLIYRRLTRKRR